MNGNGYEFKIPTELLKTILPALRWGLLFLRIALATQGENMIEDRNERIEKREERMEDREERREDGEDENMIEDREERIGSFFHATIQFNVALPETVCSIIQEDCRVSHITALYTVYYA
jgi:hypothetical protein